MYAMRRKKILLLQTPHHSPHYLMQSVEQYFSLQQHLLVKLYLLIPNTTYTKLPAKSQKPKNFSRHNIHQKPFAPGWSFEQTDIANLTREYKATFQEVVAESQFADLLMLEETLHLTCYQYHKKLTTVGALLSKATCPIMVLPEKQLLAEQIILFYDGTYQTFSLIQQFIHDFYQFSTTLPTTLLLFQTTPLQAPEEKLLIEYLKLNCRNLAVHKISAESQHTFPIAVDMTKCALVVQSRHYSLPDFMADHLNTLPKVTLTLN